MKMIESFVVFAMVTTKFTSKHETDVWMVMVVVVMIRPL
jgi:hypothetical protein